MEDWEEGERGRGEDDIGEGGETVPDGSYDGVLFVMAYLYQCVGVLWL